MPTGRATLRGSCGLSAPRDPWTCGRRTKGRARCTGQRRPKGRTVRQLTLTNTDLDALDLALAEAMRAIGNAKVRPGDDQAHRARISRCERLRALRLRLTVQT